ncbi:GNAT family N-acetyltransferase [Dysgonomonas massiliensis]|uniref:GNAT family N-acetyltransferase n=1 Tax=Dysgonomonas massiliensis TaxID=2040292 RepID=UPI000C776168|nr:GNAT family N-acetyltransferase [Dysgonomonas massiliensis]
MDYQVIYNELEHRFEVKIDTHMAVVEYRDRGDHWAVVHTFVPPHLEGRGIAGALTKTLLDYAKENGIKIKPVCPYTVSYVKRHPEYNDILVG